MMKLDEFISLSEGKTVLVRFSIDWTKTFEGIKTPHRKQDCSDCDNRKNFSDCVKKPKMNCFNCAMETACKTCLGLVSQKKTYSTDINMLKNNLQTNIIKCFLNMKANTNTNKIFLILNLHEKF